MRTGSYLLIVRRDVFVLEVWRRRTLPPLQYRLIASHPISVGQVGYETEAGVYWVLARARNPAWYVPDSDWAGDLRGQVLKGNDPRNPIKAAFLKLGDQTGIGIHGTDNLDSLGTRASHGCIRVHPKTALDLYHRVRKGTPVVIL